MKTLYIVGEYSKSDKFKDWINQCNHRVVNLYPERLFNLSNTRVEDIVDQIIDIIDDDLLECYEGLDNNSEITIMGYGWGSLYVSEVANWYHCRAILIDPVEDFNTYCADEFKDDVSDSHFEGMTIYDLYRLNNYSNKKFYAYKTTSGSTDQLYDVLDDKYIIHSISDFDSLEELEKDVVNKIDNS